MKTLETVTLPKAEPTIRWTAYLGSHPISARSADALADAKAERERYAQRYWRIDQ